MCEQCFRDCLAFHDYAVSTGGSLAAATIIAGSITKDTYDLEVLATLGISMAAEILISSSSVPNPKFVVTKGPTKLPEEYVKPAECYVSAMQSCLDRNPDLQFETIQRFLANNDKDAGNRLVAVATHQYLKIASTGDPLMQVHGLGSN